MLFCIFHRRYSPCRAFKMELNEVNDQAGQREVIAENLQATVLRELNILVKDFKEDRKKYLQEGIRLRAALAGQIGNLERARKAYEKAFREAERAVENYQRADADLNLSRAEVSKRRSYFCPYLRSSIIRTLPSYKVIRTSFMFVRFLFLFFFLFRFPFIATGRKAEDEHDSENATKRGGKDGVRESVTKDK